MEKVDIKLSKSKKNTVKIGDVDIKVDKYIPLKKYEIILEDIKTNVFYDSEVQNKAHMTDLRFVRDVVELCTNINIDNLKGEDFMCPELCEALAEGIENYYDIRDYINKEYDRFIMENCFGVLANKLPTTTDMEASMDRLSETINNLPSDKLELIAKGIVWNNMPALGNVAAPAGHQPLLAEA